MIAICLIVKLAPFTKNMGYLATLVVLAIALVIVMVIIFCQPQNEGIQTFKVSISRLSLNYRKDWGLRIFFTLNPRRLLYRFYRY